ncbi:Peptidyl-prolyl cis-trans isomerase FKBP16-3 [Arachis hypogaea]|nr:Peptidyl-prolyl cis-trans isomerase FKBP16-3 [Arachis hypogaea]
MASSSSVAGWSSSLCVTHRCSVLLRSFALPIASPRPALPHRASRCLASNRCSSTPRFAVWIGSATIGSTCKSLGCNPQGIAADRLRCLVLQYRRSVVKAKASDTTECAAMVNTNSRRDFLGLALGISSLFVGSLEAKGAGLPPEDKPKLCEEACEKELENEKKQKINAEKKRKELEKERAKDELLTRKRQREERRVRYRAQCGGPKAACAGCAGFGAFLVVIEKFLDRHG